MKCDIAGCFAEAQFHFAHVESRQLTSERGLCDTHARKYFEQFHAGNQTINGGISKSWSSEYIGVDFELITYHQSSDLRPACVYLHEIGGKRRFATMIDGWAWWAITSVLRREPSPRPLGHSAWATTIQSLGGELEDVVVDVGDMGSSWRDSWYDAKLRMLKENRAPFQIDVRAGDAYVLALIQNVPLFATERLLKQASFRA